jgi:hypothetical protein
MLLPTPEPLLSPGEQRQFPKDISAIATANVGNIRLIIMNRFMVFSLR